MKLCNANITAVYSRVYDQYYPRAGLPKARDQLKALRYTMSVGTTLRLRHRQQLARHNNVLVSHPRHKS